MPSRGDKQFGNLAVERGYITQGQYKECLAIQAELEADRIPATLDRLLLDKKYMEPARVAEIQRIQKRRVVFCSCGTRMNVFKFPAGKKLTCSRCRKKFVVPPPPDEDPSLVDPGAAPPARDTPAPTPTPEPTTPRRTPTPRRKPAPPAEPLAPDFSETSGRSDSGLSAGRTVGKYEVLGLLGSGGMGSVYKARHVLLDRVDALKIIRPDVASKPEYKTMFMREAKLSASLMHPHLTQVYDIIDEEGVLAFSMHYVHGECLSDRVEAGPSPTGEALRWGAEIASALTAIHGAGLVHRDIKPSNIMIDANDRAILTDFGLAKNYEEAGTSGITGEDACIGTPSYMAPEQVDRACFVDPRADVYSLGATLYAALTGQPPFQGDTPIEVLGKVISKDPVPPRTLNPALPRNVEKAVLKMMAKNPDGRFASAKEAQEALQRLAT